MSPDITRFPLGGAESSPVVNHCSWVLNTPTNLNLIAPAHLALLSLLGVQVGEHLLVNSGSLQILLGF